MLKKFKFLVAATFATFCCINAQAASGIAQTDALQKYAPISEDEIREAIAAYYFYQGKLAMGDIGIDKFPQQAARIEQAQKELEDSIYGKGDKAIEELYNASFEDYAIEREHEKAREAFQEVKKKIARMSAEDIIRGLAPDNLCNKAQQKFCQTLVTFNEDFRNNPLLLLEQSFTARVDTKDEPRAHGLRVTFDYPSTWHVVKGKRKRDVYRIEGPSVENTMPHMILRITEPSRELTYFTDARFYADVERWVNETGKLVKITKKRVNGSPVAITEETVFYNRDGVPFSGKNLSLWLLHQDQLVQLQCGVLAQKVHEKTMDEVFNKYLPLYRHVLDTFVFHKPTNE